MRYGKKTGLLLLVLVVAAAGAGAFQIESLDAHGGILFLGNGETEGAPSPILPTWSVSLPMSFSSLFYLSPELGIFWNQYQLSSDGDKAVPTEIETANQVSFITLYLDANALFRFAINEQLSAGPLGFLSFVFRIPIRGWDEAAEDTSYAETMTGYLYGSGRFLYPGIGGFFNWAFSENFGFAFRLKWRVPFFHSLAGEEGGFHDQMMIVGTVGITFFF